MKKIIIALMMLGLATAGYADVNVRGYTKKDGTYVAPHKRSNPNRSTQDNWSHKGNINPYTGKTGTQGDEHPYGY